MTTAAVIDGRPRFVGSVLGALLLLIAAAATALATVASNGNLVASVLPVAAIAAAYAFYVLPVRYPLFLLIFLSLVLDVVGEGPWDSPVAPIGALLNLNVSHTLGIGPLKLPGVALALVAMAGLLVLRSFGDGRVDSRGRTPAALPFFGGLVVSIASMLGLIALGKLWGGDLQMAKIQVQTYVLLLLTAWVCAMSLRGMEDYRILARIVVFSAVIRSAYVMFVVHHLTGSLSPSEGVAVAATHGDSLLFAAATVLLIARLMESPSRRSTAWCVALLPILVIGMQLNGRRLVWVELIAGLLTVMLIIRRGRMKRLTLRALLFCLPLLVTYITVGWDSQAKVFGPIRTYRSLTEGDTDSSTLYRDVENYNLMQTMRIRPLMGTGFGQPFDEVAVLPNIATMFKEYRYMPHNSILGLWAFAGPFGFTGLTMALVIAAYFSSRSYRMAASSDERLAALMIMAMLMIYLQHCWGDIGFSERRTIVLVGPVLALAGQLAHRTGAYAARGGVRSDVRRAA